MMRSWEYFSLKQISMKTFVIGRRPSRIVLRMVFLLSAMAGLGGCGTLCNLGVTGLPHQDRGPLLIYGGVQINASLVDMNLLFLVDTPFCFALDTVTLPATLT